MKNLIPKAHTGILSGQWGTFKTLNALDMAASVMTGTPFARREVCTAVVFSFIAAEGAFEIPVRLQGLVDHKSNRSSYLVLQAGIRSALTWSAYRSRR